jgi:hypothetical protein
MSLKIFDGAKLYSCKDEHLFMEVDGCSPEVLIFLKSYFALYFAYIFLSKSTHNSLTFFRYIFLCFLSHP